MSYNVVQKIRNNYYLYEVTSEWDPQTKRSRQKRKYIGKCDPDGNLESVPAEEIIIKDMGQYHLLFDVCVKSGLWKALNEAYSPENAKILITYALFRTSRNYPPTHVDYGIRYSSSPEYFNIPMDSRTLTVEGIINTLDSAAENKDRFFKTLCGKNETAMVFNSEILRDPVHFFKLFGNKSRSNFNEFPPMSHFTAVNMENNRPFFYKLAKYRSLNQETLRKVYNELAEIGIKKVVFNLRVPGCSEAQVPRFIGSDFDTILTVDSESQLTRKLVDEHIGNAEFDTEFVDGSLYRYCRFKHRFFVTECDVYIVIDTKAHEDKTLSFYKRLEYFETGVRRMKWSDDAEGRISDLFEDIDFLNLVNISKGADGHIEVKRNRKAVQQYENLLGMTLIINNSDVDLHSIIRTGPYYDRYEQDLSIFRTDLQGGASLFPSNESAVSSLFGDFLSHHVKACLIERIRNSRLEGKMNFLDVISSVSNIKACWINGKHCISRIDDSQKDIFDALGVESPNMDKSIYRDC